MRTSGDVSTVMLHLSESNAHTSGQSLDFTRYCRDMDSVLFLLFSTYQEKLSAKMGKVPPANPGSPATPKKGGKVGGAVSNGLPLLNGKGSSAAVGAKMSPAAHKMSTIASTVASLQVTFHQESIETKNYKQHFRPTKQYLSARSLVLTRPKSTAFTNLPRLKNRISWTQAS